MRNSVFNDRVCFTLKEVQVMLPSQSDSMQDLDIEHDAIDQYFECITACSIGDDGMLCITQCIETHLKDEAEQ